MRAVERMPTDFPASDIRRVIGVTRLPSTVAQSPRTTLSLTPTTPALVLTPASIAVPVPAESGVCAFVL